MSKKSLFIDEKLKINYEFDQKAHFVEFMKCAFAAYNKNNNKMLYPHYFRLTYTFISNACSALYVSNSSIKS